MAGTLRKFLKPDCQEVRTVSSPPSSPQASTSASTDINEDVTPLLENQNLEVESVNSKFDVGSNDPGEWDQNITSEVAKILVQRGPIQIKNLHYPANEKGRSFSNQYYIRSLPNGEQISRTWLLYSTSKNSVFCFCCKIFGKQVDITKLADNDGFSNWQHLSSKY